MLVYQRVPRKIQHGQMKSACSVGPYFSNLPLGHQIVRNFPHWSWRFSSPGNHRTTWFFFQQTTFGYWRVASGFYIPNMPGAKIPMTIRKIILVVDMIVLVLTHPKNMLVIPTDYPKYWWKNTIWNPPTSQFVGEISNEVRYGSVSHTGHAAVVSPWLHT